MNQVTDYLEKHGLGLFRDGVVVLTPHQPLWIDAASFEIERLRNQFSEANFEFHHIGSTSVPTICAKPILDLMILSPELDQLNSCQHRFESLGYEFKGEYGIAGRRFLVLYDEQKQKSYVHIHAFQRGHEAAARHLLFRDYLRAVPEAAEEYQKLKLELSESGMPRSEYTELKTAFIEKTLEAANFSASFRAMVRINLLGGGF